MMPSRLPAGLLAAAVLSLSTGVRAEDYVNKTSVPDAVLAKNIERLATGIMAQEPKEDKVAFKVTQVLGREDLGQGKSRIWFCIASDINGKKSTACGGDTQLIQLDTGRWILQDIKRSSWIVIRK
jgi:hypothetical protein